MYRMHRFRSRASPVKGLTADVLVSLSCQRVSYLVNDSDSDGQIQTAEIAYDRHPTYDRYAPTQAQNFSALSRLLDNGQVQTQQLDSALGLGDAGMAAVAAAAA